jgi:hypothetical protein
MLLLQDEAPKRDAIPVKGCSLSFEKAWLFGIWETTWSKKGIDLGVCEKAESVKRPIVTETLKEVVAAEQRELFGRYK